MRKRAIAVDHRCPRPASRILVERFAVGCHQRHDAGERVLLHVRQVLCETKMGIDAVQRATDRPEEHHAQRRLSMSNTECDGRTASHAGAHDVRPRDIEMLEQPLALRSVMRPRDALDAAARLPTFSTVEDDAGVLLRQMFHGLDAGVHALRAPFFNRGVESPWREHQQGWASAHDFVASGDAVNDRGGHVSLSPAFTASRLPPSLKLRRTGWSARRGSRVQKARLESDARRVRRPRTT
jgi:hypothetical protein